MEKRGLDIKRYFTSEDKDVYDEFEWEKSNVEITDDSGKLLFVQTDAEFPKGWSPLARKIVASKYFFGERGTSQRETSVRQLVKRVSETFGEWALNQRYFDETSAIIFRDELAYLALAQRMSFNSPVWFNVGVHKIVGEGSNDKKTGYIIQYGQAVELPVGKDRVYPQTSACFIQSVEDSMESIMDLARKEAMLFKHGSGTGTNLSTLRSSREKLSGGGKPSGPMAYWAFYDKVAGIVKSGGKTRRAAKMEILNIDHPDIAEWITSKMKEEAKIRILLAGGVKFSDAQESVNYQNTNISVRATDAFMMAIERDEKWRTVPVHNKEMADEMPVYNARDLLRKIAEATYFCGDPGMQFHDTINRWHTCPNSAPINASNPCSEYMFVDNSSCNLASLNLMRFMRADGTFDINAFSQAVRLTAIAQDLEIDNSSYPTKEIAENSHRFRPLGTGYANLGSMLMFLGLPYDSDEARATASAVTALLTGKVYETSTEMAERIGPFEEFGKNRDAMLKVIRMHRDALRKIDGGKLPKGLEAVLDEAERTWERVIERGEKYGFRNAQATVLAPTGTIGFMMDADTKGIEPEIGLVQKKKLSDGGLLNIVNSTIEPALIRLGYGRKEIDDILKYVNEHEMMEGAPHIKPEHLAVFDCANKPENGTRTISYQGHLKMMAAVQPFISGAISKTVNLPKEATIEEIEKVYMDAWRMGLKSVAIYRDGSKGEQPLSFSKKTNLETMIKPIRRRLPSPTREAKVHKFNIGGHEGYLCIGLYEDGQPGEVFVNMSREGSTIGGLMGTVGILTSVALQYGVPLETIITKLKDQRFEPRGVVLEGHPDIKTAESIIDYLVRFLEAQFLNKKKNGNTKNSGSESKLIDVGSVEKAPLKANNENKIIGELTTSFCANCGSQMYKRGHCEHICPKCGWTDPKGCGE